jgi:hypothetical protein
MSGAGLVSVVIPTRNRREMLSRRSGPCWRKA